jgi:hypothetical protein
MISNSVAWAAGVLEGEGCFSKHVRKSNGKTEVAIHCEMTDQDIIERLKNVFNVGTICYRSNKNRGNRKPTWIWSVQSKKEIKLVLDLIYDLLGERRKNKAKELLNEVRSLS